MPSKFDTHDIELARVVLGTEIKRVDDLLGAEARRVDGMFDAQETAVNAALVAQEKAVAAALAASEKAVNKAEIAQQRVNETQNEFRGSLKDQANTLMPRLETENIVREIRGLVSVNTKELGDLRSRIDIGPPSLSLLQSRSDEGVGGNRSAQSSRALVFSVAAVTFGFIGMIGTIIAIVFNLSK